MTYTSTDSSDQTEVKSWTLSYNTQHVHYQTHEKRKRRRTAGQSLGKLLLQLWDPPTLLALELLGWGGGEGGAQRATTGKHEPFQQWCNTVSFWFQHRHSRMLSVHTTKFCLQPFQELLGKVKEAADPRVALTPRPTAFQRTPFTLGAGPSAEGPCSHKCYIAVVSQQNHLDIIVLKWRL